MSNEFIAKETENLIKQWESYDQNLLSDYLVKSFQDPRINPQSLLARHELIDIIANGELRSLGHAELKWAFDANRILRDYETTHNVSVHKLSASQRNIPENILYEALYEDLLSESQKQWEKKWTNSLSSYITEEPKLRVLEAACGAANDYRFFKNYGLDRLVDYKGFDLNITNVATSQKNYPEAQFVRGNILTIEEQDKSWDVVVMHDIFEHLHIDACYIAMKEVFRVAKRRLIVTYFSMAEIDDHKIKPVKYYHWNVLSRSKIEEFWKSLGAQVDSIHISTIGAHFGFSDFHNPKAYTFVITPFE